MLVLGSGSVPVVGGAATLVLTPPQQRCDDHGTRDLLPTGVRLLLTREGGGIDQAYAPIGLGLARWLLASRQLICPS
jgi:hypothetical protein